MKETIGLNDKTGFLSGEGTGVRAFLMAVVMTLMMIFASGVKASSFDLSIHGRNGSVHVYQRDQSRYYSDRYRERRYYNRHYRYDYGVYRRNRLVWVEEPVWCSDYYGRSYICDYRWVQRYR